MKKVQVLLSKLECKKTSERQSDEIYFEIEAEYKNSDLEWEGRYPKGEDAVLELQTGMTILPKDRLLELDLGQGLDIEISVFEQDLEGILAKLFDDFDDLIGQVGIAVYQNGQIAIIAKKYTTYEGLGDNDASYRFEMTGAKANYWLELSVNIIE